MITPADFLVRDVAPDDLLHAIDYAGRSIHSTYDRASHTFRPADLADVWVSQPKAYYPGWETKQAYGGRSADPERGLDPRVHPGHPHAEPLPARP